MGAMWSRVMERWALCAESRTEGGRRGRGLKGCGIGEACGLSPGSCDGDGHLGDMYLL
jgi:hypothetical protein